MIFLCFYLHFFLATVLMVFVPLMISLFYDICLTSLFICHSKYFDIHKYCAENNCVNNGRQNMQILNRHKKTFTSINVNWIWWWYRLLCVSTGAWWLRTTFELLYYYSNILNNIYIFFFIFRIIQWHNAIAFSL